MSFNYSIGRSSQNDICLNDKTVSSFHARISLGSDGFMWIEDLNSMNGTYVNGFKVSGRSKIKPGDRLSLGAYEFDWMSQIMNRQSTEKANVPVAVHNENMTATAAPKKSYVMQYAIVTVLGITILATVLLGANFSNWGKNKSDKEITAKEDSTNTDDDNEGGGENGDEKEGGKKGSKTGGSGGGTNPKRETKHDLSCLRDQDLIGQGIGIGKDIEDEVLKNSKVKVTVDEEIEVGAQAKKDILSKSSLLRDASYVNRIDRIMNQLLANLDNPKFDYKWYVVNENIINAMTCGGNIFIYKGIIDFAESDDEIAAILAHEIYHNELGHIAAHIKKEKIARGIFGELGQIPLIAASIITMPNNQHNEANCDLYGIDLCERAGYDGCQAEKLWQRMNKKEGKRNAFDKLFASHPFSTERANCINHHMKSNYRTCSH